MTWFIKLSILVSAAVAQQQCETGWVNYDTSCYRLASPAGASPNNFHSERECNDDDGHLAAIGSEGENNFLKSWMASAINDSTEGVWLDGHRHVDWEWEATGASFSFTDWAPVQGNTGRCMVMSRQFNYSWVPEDCHKDYNLKYICEKDLCQERRKCSHGSCYTLYCSPHEALPTATTPVVCPSGSLARIESERESEYIKGFLKKSEDFITSVWIGGYSEDQGNFKWQGTDEPIIGFTDWVMTSGNSNDTAPYTLGCIAMSRKDSWAWMEYDCYTQRQILCEEKDPSRSDWSD